MFKGRAVTQLVEDTWSKFDINQDGFLQKPELCSFLDDYTRSIGPLRSEIQELIFKKLDKNNDGMISKEEFVEIVKIA